MQVSEVILRKERKVLIKGRPLLGWQWTVRYVGYSTSLCKLPVTETNLAVFSISYHQLQSVSGSLLRGRLKQGGRIWRRGDRLLPEAERKSLAEVETMVGNCWSDRLGLTAGGRRTVWTDRRLSGVLPSGQHALSDETPRLGSGFYIKTCTHAHTVVHRCVHLHIEHKKNPTRFYAHVLSSSLAQKIKNAYIIIMLSLMPQLPSSPFFLCVCVSVCPFRSSHTCSCASF